MTSEEDKELQAISATMKALVDLDSAQQKSALEYVMSRLGITTPKNDNGKVNTHTGINNHEVQERDLTPIRQVGEVKDIRTLKEEKNPKSAIQMAVLVAYYLSRVVPNEEKMDSIGTNEIDKYFDQAKYPLPKSSAVLLGDAKRAGYLESTERGKYKLNPVGYNLAAHSMGSDNKGALRTPYSSKKKRAPKKK